jgi:hypothetical protein
MLDSSSASEQLAQYMSEEKVVGGTGHSVDGARQYRPGHAAEVMAQEEPLREPDPASERDTANHSNQCCSRFAECEAYLWCEEAQDSVHSSQDGHRHLEQYDLPITSRPRVASSFIIQA